MSDAVAMFRPRLARRRLLGRCFALACILMSSLGAVVLAVLLVAIFKTGWSSFSFSFLTSFPSVLYPERAGIKSALYGSLYLVAITAVVAVPVGVASAVYLQEYAPNNRLTRFIQLNITNLAGVPSIVYGILGVTVFVRAMRLDRSLISGGLILSLLILPVIIIATREALAAVPSSIRHAAYALGATRWQTVRAHVLPSAIPGIMTGVILAMSRAIGEAAPLLVIGALTHVAFLPEGLRDMFTALPIQIYAWCDAPQEVFHHLAAAGIVALLGILLPLNAIAVAIRAWQQRKKAW